MTCSRTTGKSNLHVKERSRRRTKVNDENKIKKQKEKDKVLGANIIFGLDNGATGTISCIIPYSKDDIDIYFDKTFAIVEDDYQKDSQKIARIDWKKLKDWFEKIIKKSVNCYIKKYSFDKSSVKIAVIMERPMINSTRFKQSKNAARAFESTLVVLEMLRTKRELHHNRFKEVAALLLWKRHNRHRLEKRVSRQGN